MLAAAVPRKPAPMLAMRTAGARGRVGPYAFGNAAGGSPAATSNGDPLGDFINQNQGTWDARTAETDRESNRFAMGVTLGEQASSYLEVNGMDLASDTYKPYRSSPQQQAWEQLKRESNRERFLSDVNFRQSVASDPSNPLNGASFSDQIRYAPPAASPPSGHWESVPQVDIAGGGVTGGEDRIWVSDHPGPDPIGDSVGDAFKHPWEGTKGAVKGLVIQPLEGLLNGLAEGPPRPFLPANFYDMNPDVARPAQVTLPGSQFSNPAQAGGAILVAAGTAWAPETWATFGEVRNLMTAADAVSAANAANAANVTVVGKTLNTYTGDVYSPDFVGPVQWKYFYRGDATARTDFLSSMAQERGVQATTDFLNNRASETFSDLYAEHGVGSQGLPTIGVSDNPQVAEYFARGPYQNQDGFVTTFRLSPQDAETFAIPNYENDYSFFENNPDIGLPEREYLFHVQIDPKFVFKQAQVSPK